MRSDTVWLCGSTTHTAGRPFASVSALAGTSTPGGAASLMRPVTVAPSRMASGGSVMPTLTWKVRVAGSAWGATSRTRPVALTCGSSVRAISHHRVARAGPDELLGHVEDGVAPALARELHDHLPGTDHLARFGADRGDRARAIGEQDRVAQLLLRDAQLRLGGVDLGLGASAKACWASSNLARGVQPFFRSSCCRQKVRRAWVSAASADDEVGLRRAQRVLLVLRVEPGDDLAGREHVAHVDGPLDHASVEAEGEAGLVLGADLAGQRDGLAVRTVLDGDRANGPRLGRARDLLAAARNRTPRAGSWWRLPSPPESGRPAARGTQN